MRALAYVRVSRKGMNPGSQVLVIREWVTRSSAEVVSYYIDVGCAGCYQL